MHVCTHVRMHVCRYVPLDLRTHICLCVCACMCIYEYMYECLSVCVGVVVCSFIASQLTKLSMQYYIETLNQQLINLLFKLNILLNWKTFDDDNIKPLQQYNNNRKVVLFCLPLNINYVIISNSKYVRTQWMFSCVNK